MKRFLQKCLFSLFFVNLVHAESLAIIGGIDGTEPFSALVSPTGVLTPVAGFPAMGLISDVDINVNGRGILGGVDTGTLAPIGAFVSPSGVLTPFTGLPAIGSVSQVAITNAGNGLIAGSDGIGPIAALVSSSGTVSLISGTPASGIIFDVDINNSNFGILGGRDTGAVATFGALVSPTGALTPLGSLPADGTLEAVAINENGNAIVGGSDSASGAPFSALVSSAGAVTPLSSLPAMGDITSVAINDGGTGIIGGTVAPGSTPYAALVNSSGGVTPLSGAFPTFGEIRSVDINNAGMGIIGGRSTGPIAPFSALVDASGVITPLTNLPATGQIEEVAINNAGIGIIGGTLPPGGYSALISPTGVVTPLTGLPATGSIDAVAILDTLVPDSFAPGGSFSLALFDLSAQIVPAHQLYQKVSWHLRNTQQTDFANDVSLLADASGNIRWKKPKNEQPCFQKPTFTLWGSAFGDYTHLKSSSSFPKSNNWLAGAILGLDYLGIEDAILGGGGAYAYNYADFGKGVGDTHLHEGFLTLYGAYNREHFFLNVAAWGGYYHLSHTRNIALINSSAKSDLNGWLFSPHLEMSFPFYGKSDWFLIDPFFMFDWANNWQEEMEESGASGLNIAFDSQYTSLLRSEVGFRFCEFLPFSWGKMILVEKGSYVNLKPFSAGTSSAFFVGSPSTFSVEIFPDRVQNLGAAQFLMQFIPCGDKYPYGEINFQGEWGSSYQSYLFSFEIGKDF